MKYKNKIYLLVAFLVFSACEIKWDMNVEFNENFSGKYTIKLLINEELQLYALDIGEESSIGSLNDIITDLPDGFGSSIFQEDAYLGILVRNDFDNIDELKDQFELLKSNENTALLLLPIEEIDFQNNDGEFRIYGSFGELFDTENEIINQSGYENVFDGKLGFKVPGEITKPNINNIVENTIIFEADGVTSKTFELISIIGTKTYFKVFKNFFC